MEKTKSSTCRRRGGLPVREHRAEEAHEVQGQHGGHAPEGQALQHGAADAGRVAVVFGLAVGGAVLLAAARLAAGAAQHRHGEDQHAQHHCCMLGTCGDTHPLDKVTFDL
ncbi:hypothetical protein EYF80_056667 [Liparis tanakae]|uniref:Uncharacterized protein n=1 Tax=Liparis tanakae TaxID=230148 RepID=A0A4Z2EX16_9TELE|nr:hypothetical protein EYF80_056667 [Liparis tanakae]